MAKEIKTYSKNVYSKKSLLDSDNVFKELRSIGDVVYLSKHKLYAITTYSAVTQVLSNNEVFISGKGVSANKFVNSLPKEITILSDGADHLKRKGILMRPLSPTKMKELREGIHKSAEDLVQGLSQKGDFDVVSDFASFLPLTVVRKMVGLPKEQQDKMLAWAAAGFQAFGPMNWLTIKSLPTLMGLRKYVTNLDEDGVEQGGWAAGVFAAAKSGKITLSEAQNMIMDYVVPSLDTTILASAHLFWLLAKHPEKYQELRDNPDLIPSAVNEAVRLASPGRGFTRYAIKEQNVNDYMIPKDSRVLALVASGNMDEAKYPNPKEFDIRRDPKDLLSWGYGVHQCAGIHLARLEIEALAKALCKNVKSLEVGEPSFIVNNILQGFQKLSGKLVT